MNLKKVLGLCVSKCGLSNLIYRTTNLGYWGLLGQNKNQLEHKGRFKYCGMLSVGMPQCIASIKAKMIDYFSSFKNFYSPE